MGAVQKFLTAIRQAGRSAATIQQYGWHLRQLSAWLQKRGYNYSEVTRHVLREWGAELHDTWAAATIKQAICAARAFFRWCHEEELRNDNPALALAIPKVPTRPQRTVTLAEVRALIESCDPSTAIGLRDLAIILTLIDTGLRASELTALDLTKLKLETRQITVKSKGGRHDTVTFGAATAEVLQKWTSQRIAKEEGEEALFVSVGGNTPGCRLTPRGLRTIIRRRGEAAGVKGLSPHAFRRGFAVISIEAGAPSRLVQIAGRWKDLKMLERYTLTASSGIHDRWSPGDLCYLDPSTRD